MNWLPILAALGLCVAGLGIIWAMVRKAEKSGLAESANEQKGAVLDAIVEHKKIENDVGALPADSARKRLSEWSRD